MRLVAKLLVPLILALPLAANANAITLPDIFAATGFIDAEGRYWEPNGVAPTTLGTDNTWANVTAQCDPLTGVCGNQWNSLHWASLSQVLQLFSEIAGLPPAAQSTNGAAAIGIESVLGDTYTPPGSGESIYSGITRDANWVEVSVGYNQMAPYLLTGAGSYQTRSCNPSSTCNDVSFTAFAYRAVPEPGSLGLAVLGLAGIAFARWKRRTQIPH